MGTEDKTILDESSGFSIEDLPTSDDRFYLRMNVPTLC